MKVKTRTGCSGNARRERISLFLGLQQGVKGAARCVRDGMAAPVAVQVQSAQTLGSRVLCAPFLLLLLGLVCLPGRLHAQATSGSITGFVRDASGGAVPHSAVKVTNQATNIMTEVPTDDSGFYNATHLIAGTYTVTVTANGYKTFTKTGIEVPIDAAVQSDAALDLGNVSEVINVTADPAELKTEKTDVDYWLDEHELESLPQLDDNLTNLYTTAPGVVPFSFQIGTNENPGGGFMTSVNGQLWRRTTTR